MGIAEFLEICHTVLVPKIDAFFDAVFVMCEDKDLKQNRLRLLKHVALVTSGILDFSKMPGL